jgi:hypothetical protein
VHAFYNKDTKFFGRRFFSVLISKLRAEKIHAPQRLTCFGKIADILDDIIKSNNMELIENLKSHYRSLIDNDNLLFGHDAYVYCRLLNKDLINQSISISLDEVTVPLINTGVLNHPQIGEITGYFLGHWDERVHLVYEITPDNLQQFFEEFKSIITPGEFVEPSADNIDWESDTFEVYANSFYSIEDEEEIDISMITENIWDYFEISEMEHQKEGFTAVSEAWVSFDFLN